MTNTTISQRPVDLADVEALRAQLNQFFFVDDTTLDWPEPGHVRFRGRFHTDPAGSFEHVYDRFTALGFTPMLRAEAESSPQTLIAMPGVVEDTPSNWRLNLLLFLLTILSTLYVGATSEPGFVNPAPGTDFVLALAQILSQLWMGWPFSLGIMLILGAHELGHYFAARYHRVPVTLPYFIPIPTIFGTMGAFIRLKGPVRNRRSLFDVGVSGPLAGLIFTIPVLFIGLATSELGPPPAGTYLQEGNSILYALAKLMVFGQFLPGNGIDVQLNQLAFAGWAGLFVTGLNLIPIGQLDGGHVAYTLFGKVARRLYWPLIIGLVLVAAFTQTWSWTLWIILLFFFGRVYAEPLDDVTPLDPRRRFLAYLTLLLFVLVFVPIPIILVNP